MKNVLGPLALTMLLSAGCTGRTALLDDARYQTGSRTMVATEAYDALLQVNVDEGSVSLTPLDGGEPSILELGPNTEPTRIARVGNQIYVTLRGAGEVAVLEQTVTGLQEVDRIPIGAEPYGVVGSEDGSNVFVTVSMENRVVQIDPASNTIVGGFDVGDDPRWLALHPKGKALYIGSARGGQVHSVELDEEGNPDGTVDVVPLPVTSRTVDNIRFDPSARVMGDLAVDPFGEFLIVPTMYVDNFSEQPGLTPDQDPTTGYYVNPQPGVARFNAALVQVPLTGAGDPSPEQANAIFLASFVEQDFNIETIRSYPNSVSISPDGDIYAVSMEASDAVVLVGRLDFDSGARNDNWIEAPAGERPDQHGYVEHPHTTIDLRRGSGPRGVVWLGDSDAWVHDWMNVSATDLAPGTAMERVRDRGRKGVDDTLADSARANIRSEMPRELTVFHNGSESAVQLRNGRQLFYGSRNPAMQVIGSGVSCSTCHVDGRDDGLTWQLGPNRRQTPTLAGVVSDTHPVTWNGDVESVAAEAEITSTVRMGGLNLSSFDYRDIQTFIDWTRPVILPDANYTDPRIAEGEAIFNREDVGCASCHAPETAFSNDQRYEMYGLAQVNPPTLLGIAASAPYLHDGRAATLADVLELSRTGEMGDTSSLSDSQMDALEAYLKSL